MYIVQNKNHTIIRRFHEKGEAISWYNLFVKYYGESEWSITYVPPE